MALVAAVHERTGGNPLFVGELARLLISEHQLDTATVYARVPEGVRDVLRRRLQRLPENSVTLMTVAAVIARPATVDLLARSSSLDDDAVLDACEAALLCGLLIDDEERPGHFRLSHDLVRQTLEESVSTARRLSMHAKIGLLMAERQYPSSEELVETARHLLAASSLLGPERALDFLQRTADDALGRLAFRRAENDLRTALELAGTIRDPREREAAERSIRARTQLAAIFQGEARNTRDAAPATHDAAGWTVPLEVNDPTAWWGAMNFGLGRADFERVRNASDEVISTSPHGVVAVAAHYVSACASMYLGELDEAETKLRVLHRLLRDPDFDLSLPEMYTATTGVHVMSAFVAHLRDQPEKADHHFEAASSRAIAASDLAIVAMHAAFVAAARGQVEIAAQQAEACAEYGRQIDSPFHGPMSAVVSAWAAALAGDPAGPSRADRAYREYRKTGLSVYSTVFLTLRAEAYARHDSAGVACELAREALALVDATGERVLGSRLTQVAHDLATTDRKS